MHEPMKMWATVLVLISVNCCQTYGIDDAINVGIISTNLSQNETEIIRNVTTQVQIRVPGSKKINLFFMPCNRDADVMKIGNEVQVQNTTMIVSFGCAEKFIQLIKIMKFPVISTMSQRASKSVGAERGHLRWKEPTSVAFSNIVNEILLRQDWYEIVVLYDADYVDTFREYMSLTWTIGQRRGYPIEISNSGSLTATAQAKLDIFGNFSIHAVILMCQERHVQPIVNMIKTVNKSHSRIVPSLILHNPISNRLLVNALESQIVIGLNVNYTLNEKMATNYASSNEFSQNDMKKTRLSNAVYSTADGILNCASNLKKNQSLKSVLYRNISECIKQEGDNFHYDILNLRNGTFQKIGTAGSDGKGINIFSLIKQNMVVENFMADLRRPLRVVTIHDPPFVWIEKTKNGGKLYRGFLIDILNKIQEMKKFEYTIYEVADDEYGSFYDGKWIGMVGDVFYDKADLGLAPFTVDEIRSKIITFVQPFMKANVAYLKKRQTAATTSLTQFLEPFTTNVWLTILTSIFVVTLSIYFVDFIGPHGWRQWRLRKEGKPGHQFGLFNSLWFTIGCILRQGAYVTPRSFPSRFLVAVFWFIVLIQMSSYTANLAAYFTFRKSVNEIQDLETLAKMDYHILIFKHSVIHTQLKTSTYQPYQMIYEKIEAYNAFVHLFTEGIDQIRNSTEKTTILLSESPFLEDLANKRPCDLVAVNSFLPVRSYSFVVPFNSPLYDVFSIAIIQLQESGFIEAKRKQYWDNANECMPTPVDSGNDYGRITLKQMAGVYAVLLGGIVVSVITLLLEIFWKGCHTAQKNANRRKVAECKEMDSYSKQHQENTFESSFAHTYGDGISAERFDLKLQDT